VAYAGGNKGVFKTENGGQTWTNVYAKGNGVIGTPSTLYTSFGFPGGPGNTYDPQLSKATRNPGTAWTLMAKPAGMTNGSKRASVTFDGTRYIILAGCWNAGIWRYAEDASADIRIRPRIKTEKARSAGLYDPIGRFLGRFFPYCTASVKLLK
jgi:hypothetical protein